MHAWGRYNSTAAGQHVQFKLYFNPGNPANLMAPIADSDGILFVNAMQVAEWHFFAQITVQLGSGTGVMWCDALIENVDRPLVPIGVVNKMIGLLENFLLNNQVANSLELTATTDPSVSLILDQCSIEYLPSPCSGPGPSSSSSGSSLSSNSG